MRLLTDDDVALLSAQNVHRLRAVRRDPEFLAGLEHRLPHGRTDSRGVLAAPVVENRNAAGSQQSLRRGDVDSDLLVQVGGVDVDETSSAGVHMFDDAGAEPFDDLGEFIVQR